ncbi:MAG: ABC transporter ATP-binding protein [Hoeflea sp.]|uniref:ABC transporter ATP-binding protein n=1 Tax=Hoeflea sp. TaxID=1940281 RepID=UPI00272F32D5|nr:ABC transporter ATP-binding protein [Hoeflea sp.]MDP2119051.1 ABC transporter ATP-binding protein [Hoeflea sp.]MDZ7603780.1 ABC transporter ATP-binding protein [Hoeflea sp.]
MASIAFNNVTKRFGDTIAVNNLSFEIADSEFFCLFGPPLSGKTTILKLILGLEKPDDGEILIDGRPVNHVSPARRNVAMVFQNLALFPHMSAEQNVRFPLAERRMDESHIASRVADVAAKLHIGHILHKSPAQLSGGERQRVAIARALVRDPVAYLMDDPISALDARLREETRVELKRIQNELGRTMVYVTHDQEEAMSVADRIAVLEAGSIRQIGAPSEIYDNPHSSYVARMLGAPAMNLLELDKGRASALEGALPLSGLAVPDGAAQIGIRPEDLLVGPALAAGQGLVRVYEVEPLGGVTVVTLQAGETSLRAMVRGQPKIDPDSQVSLSVAAGQACFFAGDGQAVRI